ncbi:hypothetical protein SynBIOSU31_00593 [Synechococcus sp. BIOS-U3-1]|uniref:hypothetical protein n=1 Tax=Synechococcus sp. BIOS-U3-1 TaxID=1400865 RepID=UPI00164452B1|nr:hypothetical protein [Synechococcus sp. BIOS-U3-1]QNI57494.1 hypothetical protein SynBIOSU31_00593 [Synechococcus sp. BIOS-U3-1]|tara:strand:- start:6 stop:689 length:684 start_codon:yes stop_codon:yes gene_type:complete
MSRSLPQNWIDGTLHTLNVVRDLGWGGAIVHPSLAVFRQKPSAKSRKTKHLQWRFLPEKADDPRPFAGRTNRGQGKRLSIEGTCGTTDPWEAATIAVTVSLERWRSLHQQLEQQQREQDQALSAYWQRWYARQEQQPRSNHNRWLIDKWNLWNGSIGLGLQPWATTKSIERISSNDFLEFFLIVRKHCELKGISLDDTRRQYKALIRNLFMEARADFPALTCPDFQQ